MFVNKFCLVVLLIYINQIAGPKSIFITDKHLVLSLFVRRVLGMSPLTLQDNNGQFSLLKENVSYSQCIKGTDKLKSKIEFGIMGESTINTMMLYSCDTLRIQPTYVCRGIADKYSNILTHILRNTKATSHTICKRLLNEKCDCDLDEETWYIELSEKPEVEPMVPPSSTDLPILKVLHITDIHVDFDYSVDSNAECDEALCCRSSSVGNRLKLAGFMGDYKCGTQYNFLINELYKIQTYHRDINYVILTGNILPPDPWAGRHNISTIKYISQNLKSVFSKIPVYAAIGNYDSMPINNFPFPPCAGVPEIFNMNEIYKIYSDIWCEKLKISNDARENITNGAYYSVKHTDGLRIIAINSMFCYTSNWWLLLNDIDPMSELEWLVQQLHDAEFKKEKVHIIGHISPGSKECLKIWSDNYKRIINRYENTVAAQFFGHTHFNEFQVMYNDENPIRPISMVYIGPSFSTYKNVNPAYRIYHIDANPVNPTRMVIKDETWSADINLINQKLDSYSNDWTKVSSPLKDYNLLSYSPTEWNEFIIKMAKNRTAFNMYYRNYWHNTAKKPTCDEKCRKWILCNARSGLHNPDRYCLDIYGYY